MRKCLVLALVLALVLSLGVAPGWAEEKSFDDITHDAVVSMSELEAAEEDLASVGDGEVISLGEMADEASVPEGIQRGTELVVGTLTPMNGYFSTDMWGNNTADMDVRSLLHGYETISWTSDNGLVVNDMVVESMRVETDEQGPVYIIELAKDLIYCDGTPITAMDYVFSLLLSGAAEIAALGGTPSTLSHVEGYEAYITGQTETLSGIRLISEHTFSMRVISEYLPYFYGLAMISAKPLPISVIAPGCTVIDDGTGVHIGIGPDAETIDATGLGYTPGDFSVEMLEKTLMDPDTGYLSHPKLSSGPYALESYDREANEVVFVVNEHFKGNHLGHAPHIERIVFRTVNEATMLDELEAGKLDLINKVTKPQTMQQVFTLLTDGAELRQVSYLRTGFAYLAFACDRTPANSVAVRQAATRALDRDALVAEALPGSALRSYGYYGLGQWMATYADEGDVLSGAEALNVQEYLGELDVPMDQAAARALLEDDGWVLNADGQTYADGDGVRYRTQDGVLEPLMLRLAITENDEISRQVSAALMQALPQVGIGVEITEMPFTKLLTYYYRQEPSEYNLFFLASNFTYIFDPYYDFNTAEAYQGMINPTGLRDEALMELARQMRDTPPMNLRPYVERWLAFQQRFVELMPMVPLYSNVYYDVFTDDLKDYDVAGNSSWSLSVLSAYIQED